MAERTSFEEQNIAYWSRRAPGYSAVNQEELSTSQSTVWGGILQQAIAAQMPGRLPEQISVLDVGTGPGFFAILMAGFGYRVTAVDYTQAMLAQAQKNAGALAGRIRFAQMDAQALSFADEQFDVVVSRNLTWNLRQPEAAYRHWVRGLRPGGLLLNFDANWYRYLFDAQALRAHLDDRNRVAQSEVRDETAGTDVAAMEAIARQTPLAKRCRPAWDVAQLTALGMQAGADCEIWRRVWTKEERVNNASTPMFLVWGRKQAV